jgi:hypothetical protein
LRNDGASSSVATMVQAKVPHREFGGGDPGEKAVTGPRC